MSEDLPTYARALQSRKKRENQGNLMDDNFDEACFYSSQSKNYNYNYNTQEKQIYDNDYQSKQQHQNYDNYQNRRGQRIDYDYNQNSDYNNYYEYNQNKERSTRHTRKRRSQPTYIQNPQPSPQQLMQTPNQYPQQSYQQPAYQQQFTHHNQKSQTHRKRSFPTDKIDLPCTGTIPDQPVDEVFSQKQTKPVQPSKDSNFNELNSKVMIELQQKNRELINEIRALKTSRNEDEINELRASLQTQKNRNAQLFQDLQNSENQFADTKQLLTLKDTTIQNLQDECQKLRIEYQDLLASIRIQNDQIAQLSRRNRELELEIEKTRLAQQCYHVNMYPPGPFSMNNNNTLSTQRYFDTNSNNNNIPQIKATQEQGIISSSPSIPLNPNTNPNNDSNQLNAPSSLNNMQTKGNVHPAMRDNLYFEEPPKKADDINVHNLTDDELREKYKSYTELKDSKNWILSRAAPKGANFSHVRQEKEKLADECDELARICSKIKLEMKLRGIF